MQGERDHPVAERPFATRPPVLPNVEAWYQRLQPRPAYREYVIIPFEERRRRRDHCGPYWTRLEREFEGRRLRQSRARSPGY
jgi:hypothetical protein